MLLLPPCCIETFAKDSTILNKLNMVPPPYINDKVESVFAFEENYNGGVQVKSIDLAKSPSITQLFLSALKGSIVWESGTLKDSSTYILDLSEHIEEVENALRSFKGWFY